MPGVTNLGGIGIGMEYPRRPCATVGEFVIGLLGVYIEFCDVMLYLVADMV